MHPPVGSIALTVRVCVSDAPSSSHAAAVAHVLKHELHSTLAVPLQAVAAVDVWVQVGGGGGGVSARIGGELQMM